MRQGQQEPRPVGHDCRNDRYRLASRGGITPDKVRRPQISVARGGHIELQKHRGLSRAFERYVKPRFNEHGRSYQRRIEMRAAEAVRAARTSAQELSGTQPY